ncbi:hypothetical protein [Solitalea lacus]|uniref:hypothetical protein n=1 Tax=Solitalea lacus TaxID=2911172 RepID=UPI001EDBFC9B|nr:hypothetical protein [Solitalea lacus]UKJ09183.1 hypothetical protein L2B55_08500 [Solitalea lacus]
MAKRNKHAAWDFDLTELAEPYILPFENDDFTLTLEVLNKHSQFRQDNRRYVSFSTQELAYTSGILKLLVSIRGDTEELLCLKVTPSALMVWCSKIGDGSSLSRHAYFGLYRFVFLGGYKSFQGYYWPDFFKDKNKFLQISVEHSSFSIQAKPQYGTFFRPGVPLLSCDLETYCEPLVSPLTVQSQLSGEIVIGYVLAHTSLHSYHWQHFPFLVPFCGKATKNGASVISFESYLNDPAREPVLHFSNEELVLNAYADKMQKIALLNPCNASGEEIKESKAAFITRKQTLFNYWKAVFPLLVQQQFTFQQYSYGMRNIKGKPRKQEMHACRFSLDTPQLHFYLQDKGDYYLLRLVLKVRGKQVQFSNNRIPFFLMDRDNNIYLLTSLMDDELLDLFHQSGNKLSVLKSHLKEFFQTFLVHLSHQYPLTVIGTGQDPDSSLLNHRSLCQQPVLNISQKDNMLVLEPCMRYEDGTECNVLQSGTCYLKLEDERLFVVQRDREIEEAYKKLVLSLHPDFPGQQCESYLMLPFTFIEKNIKWVDQLKEMLSKHNVAVTGMQVFPR